MLRYDATTGAFLGAFVAPDSGGLRFPTFLTFTETDPTTLNYDGATTSTTLSVAMASTPIHPAAALPTTSTITLPIVGSQQATSGFDPSAAALGLPLSQIPATPATISSPALSFMQAPPLTPSLTSNLPPASPSQTSSTSEAATDRVSTNFNVGLSVAQLVDDLVLDAIWPEFQ